MTSPGYSMDTSALIRMRIETYAPDVFATLWERIEQLVSSGRMLVSEEVIRDLRRKDDELLKWAKAHAEMHVAIDEDTQERVRNIVNRFPSLVDVSRQRGQSDPCVIALAQTRNLVVVTTEDSKPSKPRIPDVCKMLGIDCIDPMKLFRREGWKV
ncbi:MAG: DUF4411 family protein [Planctomycetes bacterium]|nr:DUF4411 family protein [Planctomycetota bacterium]